MGTKYSSATTMITHGVITVPASSISITQAGNEIDVTELSSPEHQYIIGLVTREFSVETVGELGTIGIGDVSTLTIDVSDPNGSVSAANCLCTAKDISLELDGAVTASYTFKIAAV